MEIERRFLIPNISETGIDLNKYEYKIICQDYLYTDKLTSVRKRKVLENGVCKYFYTVKTGRKRISTNEFESEISEEVYNNLQTDSSNNTISKKRYIIPYIDGLKIELDVFEGIYEGIIFAEIEYKNESQANTVEIPKWFGKEITGIISNSKMARKSSQKIFEILNNI